MGFQVIKQPDGRLAVFSSYSDCWAVWDGSREEVAGWFAEQENATGLTRDAVLRKIDLVLSGDAVKAYGRPWTMDFAAANAKSKYHGGEVLEGPLDEGLLAFLEEPLDDPEP